MRDMTVVCSEYVEKVRCRRDLAYEQAQVVYVDYCPDAGTSRELQTTPAGCA
jgi:hypothetical protein